MFKVHIYLPATFTDSDITKIGEAYGGLETSVSALREHTHTGPWNIEWMFDDTFDAVFLESHLKNRMEEEGIELPADIHFKIKPVPEVDWLALSYEEFKPFSVGPFFIYGSHFEGNVPEGQMGLQIDAATAFGSGEHGTTKGCLQAMLDLKGRGACPWNVLDMGTGSGILAIAAWKLWKTPILAVDNDEEAVRMTEVHRESNGVPSGTTQLTSACGDGFQEEKTLARKPYDLVIANILASALREMAPQLIAVCDEKAYVILSGILNEQVQSVLDVYLPLGFKEIKRYPIGDWTSLLIQKI